MKNWPSRAQALAAGARRNRLKLVSSGNLLYMRLIILIVAIGCFLAPACTTSYQPLSLVASGPLAFPENAKDAGIDTGTVVISYDVDSAGTVSNVQVVSSNPEGYFEEEALEHVRSWRFRPAHVDGKPVVQEGVESEISFRLEEDIDLDALVDSL